MGYLDITPYWPKYSAHSSTVFWRCAERVLALTLRTTRYYIEGFPAACCCTKGIRDAYAAHIRTPNQAYKQPYLGYLPNEHFIVLIWTP